MAPKLSQCHTTCSRSSIDIPCAEPILQALEFPSTTDRNKAAAILAALAKKPELHHIITQKSGATLLAMLNLKQPNNRDWAWIILKEISLKNFAVDDVSSWTQWVQKQSKS